MEGTREANGGSDDAMHANEPRARGRPAGRVSPLPSVALAPWLAPHSRAQPLSLSLACSPEQRPKRRGERVRRGAPDKIDVIGAGPTSVRRAPLAPRLQRPHPMPCIWPRARDPTTRPVPSGRERARGGLPKTSGLRPILFVLLLVRFCP
jgi:hypothetical protein